MLIFYKFYGVFSIFFWEVCFIFDIFLKVFVVSYFCVDVYFSDYIRDGLVVDCSWEVSWSGVDSMK